MKTDLKHFFSALLYIASKKSNSSLRAWKFIGASVKTCLFVLFFGCCFTTFKTKLDFLLLHRNKCHVVKLLCGTPETFIHIAYYCCLSRCHNQCQEAYADYNQPIRRNLMFSAKRSELKKALIFIKMHQKFILQMYQCTDINKVPPTSTTIRLFCWQSMLIQWYFQTQLSVAC